MSARSGPVTVLLLRGVNVGGRNRLPMAEFRALLAGLGLQGVASHVQSGNAVFRDPGRPDLGPTIAAAMQERFGFAPALFLLSADDLAEALAQNPYQAAGAATGTAVHLVFLREPLSAAALAELAGQAGAEEAVAQVGRVLYLHTPKGIGRSVLAERLERLVKQPKTARNQSSASAILALARAVEV